MGLTKVTIWPNKSVILDLFVCGLRNAEYVVMLTTKRTVDCDVGWAGLPARQILTLLLSPACKTGINFTGQQVERKQEGVLSKRTS